MSNTVSIIFTLLIMAALIWGIVKKINAVMLLFIVGLAANIIYAIITKSSLVAEGTTSGSVIFDSFVYFQQQWANGFSSNALIIMSIVGYVGYMNHLKAGDMFAILVARPLVKFKNAKWIAVGIVVFLDWIMVMIIPSGVGTLALSFGTFYPILRYLGVSGLTAATAINVGLGVFANPSNAMLVNQLTFFGFDAADIGSIWATKLVPVALCMEVGLIATFIIWNKYCDKKDSTKGRALEDIKEVPDPKTLGIPKYYAVLPLLPLVFILGFNKVVQTKINLPIIAAVVLAFIVALTVRTISMWGKRTFAQLIEEGHTYFKEVGGAVGYIGMIIIVGLYFSGILTAAGGFTVITNFLVEKLNMSPAIFIVVGTLLSAAMYGISGSSSLSVFAITPMVANVVLQYSPELATVGLCCLGVTYGLFGSCVTPISSCNLLAASTEGVAVTDIIKRQAIPSLVSLITGTLGAFLLFG